MSNSRRYNADIVRPWAEMLESKLRPVCDQVVIAGSLRRQCETVGDIEVVIVPKPAELMQFDYTHILQTWLDQGRITRTKGEPWGYKYKKFHATNASFPSLSVDLFIAQPGNFGNILAIRTGCDEFSKALVTQRRFHGGLMLDDLRQQDGFLWCGDQMIECPTEEAFFDAIDVKWIEPQLRNAPRVDWEPVG